jgi:hypothetical protein
MRRVSAKVFGDPKSILSSAASPPVLDELKFVAKTFGELPKKRHEADYDLSGYWQPTGRRRTTALDIVPFMAAAALLAKLKEGIDT